jgi:hypothetical protein
MPDQDSPFIESLEEICDLRKWTETTEVFALPPQVAGNMRRLGVSNEPSATAIPLTTDALADLVMKFWPAPGVENLVKRTGSITFHWLDYFMIVYSNLFVESYNITPEGKPLNQPGTNSSGQKVEIFPHANSATRSLEKILRLGFEGIPLNLPVLDEEGASRLIEADDSRVFLFWRGSRIGKGQICLCGRHLKEWPNELGELRLCHLSPQLHAHLAFSDAPAVHRMVREIYEHYSGRRAYECQVCYHARAYPRLDHFFGVEALGKDKAGRFFEDSEGPLADPVYGQPLVTPRAKEECSAASE